MSVWQDLLSVSITVEAHLLEELLEVLAEASFPINPEIEHHTEIVSGARIVPAVRVEFPVWREHLKQLKSIIDNTAIHPLFDASPMLHEIRPWPANTHYQELVQPNGKSIICGE